jgi:hypothetical protein
MKYVIIIKREDIIGCYCDDVACVIDTDDAYDVIKKEWEDISKEWTEKYFAKKETYEELATEFHNKKDNDKYEKYLEVLLEFEKVCDCNYRGYKIALDNFDGYSVYTLEEFVEHYSKPLDK